MSMNNLLFEPIEHESVAEAVIDQIERLIVSGVLKQDQKLPPEREMADLFDVSRPKLREALKKLEERNLIRVQHGEGTFIAPLVGAAMSPALMELYARHDEAFNDYLEYRREQEGFAAALAADRATEVDLEIIDQIMLDMKDAQANKDEKRSEQLDFDFHTAIVDASHNATLVHMMGSIYQLTRQGVFYNRSFLKSIDPTGRKLLTQHLAIGQAIIDGSATNARQAAESHLDFVGKSFQAGAKIRTRERYALKRKLLNKSA